MIDRPNMKLPEISKAQRIGAVPFLAAICCFGTNKAYAVSSATGSPDCRRVSSKTVVSPDGAWEAMIHEEACEYGYSFTATANYVVTIISRKDHEKQGNVFAIPDHGNQNPHPFISWIGRDELLISTPHSHFFGLQKDKFEKIKILYTYQAPPPLPTRVPTSNARARDRS
jgi:hypothetical protein